MRKQSPFDLLILFWMFIMFIVAIVAVTSTIIRQAHADDSDFEIVQPIDDYARSKIRWKRPVEAEVVSDYTMYTMVAAPALMALNDDKPLLRVAGIAGTQAAVAIVTEYNKVFGDRTRPAGPGTYDSKKSFFSGHTSAAFAGAGILCVTEKEKYCHLGLGLATTTGYLRMAGDRHWLTDVLTGAVVGFLGGYHLTVAMGF